MRCTTRPVRALVLATAVAALASCASRAKGEDAPPEPGDVVVELVGLEFQPKSVQVAVGKRVRWQWTDSIVHNVISDQFASSKALAGGSYVVRFDRQGTYEYRCTLHTGMDGTVVVTP